MPSDWQFPKPEVTSNFVSYKQTNSRLSDKDASYMSALQIWIDRFAKAQAVLRQYEEVFDKMNQTVVLMADYLTDEQLREVNSKINPIQTPESGVP